MQSGLGPLRGLNRRRVEGAEIVKVAGLKFQDIGYVNC